MFLKKFHRNDRYIPTKQLFDLACDIYFLPVTKNNLQALNLSNKIIDVIIGGLEKVSDSRIDTSDKIRLYDETFKSLALSTNNLLHILLPEDDNSDSMIHLNGAMTDPYENTRKFILEKSHFQ